MAVALLVVLAVGRAPAEPAPDGALLYFRQCASCHGIGGSGDGPDAITSNPLIVGSKVSMNLGDGANSVVFGTVRSLIGATLNVTTGDGADSVALSPASVGEDATIKLGNGANSLVLDDASIGRDLIVTAGSGADSVVFLNTPDIGRHTQIHLGAGANTQP